MLGASFKFRPQRFETDSTARTAPCTETSTSNSRSSLGPGNYGLFVNPSFPPDPSPQAAHASTTVITFRLQPPLPTAPKSNRDLAVAQARHLSIPARAKPGPEYSAGGQYR